MKKYSLFIVLAGLILTGIFVYVGVAKAADGTSTNNWCNGADINKDGKVNTADFGLFRSDMGRKDCSVLNTWCNRVDINKDGKVNTADFGLLRVNMGRTDCVIIYSLKTVSVNNTVERRFYANTQHFLSVISDANNAISIRPHPGLDVNGWGSSLYLQPFLPGAILRGTTINNVNVNSSGINLVVSGIVSQGNSSNYGTWNGNITFSYVPLQKEVIGSGTYNVALSGLLGSSTGDLNLYKLASNYLVNVPLLSGGIGNTGDIKQVNVSGGYYQNLTWVPSSGSTYPQDNRNPISVEAVGDYNNVDTAKQGYAPIAAAYKPTMKVILSSNQTGFTLIFGGAFDASKSQQYWADNVAVTPLILKSSTLKNYNFNVTFDSTAIAGDH